MEYQNYISSFSFASIRLQVEKFWKNLFVNLRKCFLIHCFRTNVYFKYVRKHAFLWETFLKALISRPSSYYVSFSLHFFLLSIYVSSGILLPPLKKTSLLISFFFCFANNISIQDKIAFKYLIIKRIKVILPLNMNIISYCFNVTL